MLLTGRAVSRNRGLARGPLALARAAWPLVRALRHRRRLRAFAGRGRRTSGWPSRRCPAWAFAAGTSPCRIRRPPAGWSTSSSRPRRRIGAVNTVLVRQDGRTRGLNSDGLGFLANLRAAGAGAGGQSRAAVLLLGAGGSARAVAVALLGAGVPALRLVNRTWSGQRRWRTSSRRSARCPTCPGLAGGDALSDTALLVNCTSLGMTGQPPWDLPLDALPRSASGRRSGLRSAGAGLLAARARRGNVAVEGWGCSCIRQCRALRTGAA